jgi:hypothetical protein
VRVVARLGLTSTAYQCVDVQAPPCHGLSRQTGRDGSPTDTGKNPAEDEGALEPQGGGTQSAGGTYVCRGAT